MRTLAQLAVEVAAAARREKKEDHLFLHVALLSPLFVCRGWGLFVLLLGFVFFLITENA